MSGRLLGSQLSILYIGTIVFCFFFWGWKFYGFQSEQFLEAFLLLRLENLMTCGVPLAPPQHAHGMNIDLRTCNSLGKRISVCMYKYQLLRPV